METLKNNKKYIIIGFIILAAVFVHSFFGRGSMNHYGQNGAQNTISVSAEGEVTAIPDIASINFTISKDGKTAADASKDLNDVTSSVLKYLKEQKIEDKDIKSEYGGVNPKYSYQPIYCVTVPCPSGESKITGYTATQSITVKIRDVDTANDVKTGLSKVGVGMISGPNFMIDDEESLRDEARGLAIKNAREKAEILAKQLGVRLGKVSSFSENGGGYPIMYAKSTMSMDSATPESAPVLPKGENKIISNVTVTYSIR